MKPKLILLTLIMIISGLYGTSCKKKNVCPVCEEKPEWVRVSNSGKNYFGCENKHMWVEK